MKKIISTILVCVLLLGCVMSFTSCSKMLYGKYEAEVDALVAGGEVEYEFTPFGYTKTTKTEVLGFEKETVEEGKYKITENEDGELVTTKYDNIKAACDAGAPLSLVAKFMTYFSTVESSKDENGRTVYTGVDGETAYNKKELMKRWLDETWHELNDNGEFVQITEKMRHYVFATQYSSNNPYRAK